MHRLAATPGGWNPDQAGVIFIEQTPAPLILLTTADTDIQTLAQAVSRLPHGFPALRVVNLLQLQQQLTIDTYAETVLQHAQVIVVRLLGGRAYWPYGLEVVKDLVGRTGASLVLLPGDDRPDPDLLSHSTTSLGAAHQLWRYFTEGGLENLTHGLQFLADTCLGTRYHPPAPQGVPRVGLYPWPASQQQPSQPRVGLLFYRAHYLAGNTAPMDALCAALAQHQLDPIPVYVSSLRDLAVQAQLLTYFQTPGWSGHSSIAERYEFFPGPFGNRHPPSRPLAAVGCADFTGDPQWRHGGAVGESIPGALSPGSGDECGAARSGWADYQSRRFV